MFTCLQRLMTKRGHRVAQAFVAYAYLRGIVVDMDASKGMELLDAAVAHDGNSDNPSPVVHYVKGQALREGLYGEEREPEWGLHMHRSANEGYSLAQAILGFALLEELEDNETPAGPVNDTALMYLFLAGMNGDRAARSFMDQTKEVFDQFMEKRRRVKGQDSVPT